MSSIAKVSVTRFIPGIVLTNFIGGSPAFIVGSTLARMTDTGWQHEIESLMPLIDDDVNEVKLTVTVEVVPRA